MLINYRGHELKRADGGQKKRLITIIAGLHNNLTVIVLKCSQPFRNMAAALCCGCNLSNHYCDANTLSYQPCLCICCDHILNCQVQAWSNKKSAAVRNFELLKS